MHLYEHAEHEYLSLVFC